MGATPLTGQGGRPHGCPLWHTGAHRAVLVTTKPPGAGRRSAPSGSCPHPKHGSVYPQSMGDHHKRPRSPRCAAPRCQRDLEWGGGEGDTHLRAPPTSPLSLTLPSATVPSRGGPDLVPPPIHVIGSPVAGQKAAAKHTALSAGLLWGRCGGGGVIPGGSVSGSDSPQRGQLLASPQRGPNATKGPCAQRAAALWGRPPPAPQPPAVTQQCRRRAGGVCAALLLVQCWHPGKVGVRATREPTQCICATLVPVQLWLSCIAAMHAASVSVQYWCSCNAATWQCWCPC